MSFSEDEIEERAKAIFALERPDDIWLIQAVPARPGQNVQPSVSLDVRKQYRELARSELEAEASANADRT